MNETLSVVIADDHPIFRKGLVEVVAESPGLRLLEAVADGTAAVEACVRHQPDVLVVDFEMPRLNGADAIRELRARDLPTAVIVLTGHKDESIFAASFDAGASGFVLKDNAAEELVACIRSVARGEPYVSPSATRFVLRRRESAQTLRRERPGLEQLTLRERRILQLVSDNLTSKEIAVRLGVSPRTVENHRFRMTEKLGLSGSHSLLKFAFENKSRL
jgi:DNA-binding NarL/FixJ family response regulator